MAQPKGKLAGELAVAFLKGKSSDKAPAKEEASAEGEEDSDAGDYDDRGEAIAQELIDAVQAGDAAEVWSVFKSLMEHCE